MYSAISWRAAQQLSYSVISNSVANVPKHDSSDPSITAAGNAKSSGYDDQSNFAAMSYGANYNVFGDGWSTETAWNPGG
jgi:hypothetical protein